MSIKSYVILFLLINWSGMKVMKIKSTTLSNNYLRFTDKQHLFFILNFTSILIILHIDFNYFTYQFQGFYISILKIYISILRILHINFRKNHEHLSLELKLSDSNFDIRTRRRPQWLIQDFPDGRRGVSDTYYSAILFQKLHEIEENLSMKIRHYDYRKS